jgi:hypothetical protein
MAARLNCLGSGVNIQPEITLNTLPMPVFDRALCGATLPDAKKVA